MTLHQIPLHLRALISEVPQCSLHCQCTPQLRAVKTIYWHVFNHDCHKNDNNNNHHSSLLLIMLAAALGTQHTDKGKISMFMIRTAPHWAPPAPSRSAVWVPTRLPRWETSEFTNQHVNPPSQHHRACLTSPKDLLHPTAYLGTVQHWMASGQIP